MVDFLFVFFIFIMGSLCIGYVIVSPEKFFGPSFDLALMTIILSFLALMTASFAYLDSSRDSEVLQEQLAELKKISQILESKE
jgi:hypothetical protein